MSILPRRAVAALAAFVAGAALVAAGCSKDSTPTGPAPIYSSITISGVDTLLVGQNAGFTAVVLDTAGQVVASPQLTWTTTSSAIASVNNAGVVGGASEGDATIRASGGGVSSNDWPVAVIQGRGWVDQSGAVATLVDLHGVHFVSPRQGWVVGAQGTILHTTDAGGTWTAQVSNATSFTLHAVAFTSPTNGIVVGTAGVILRTTNGGATWTRMLAVDTGGGLGLNDVRFQDDVRGWIVGNSGIILRTTNGGASWVRVLPGVTSSDLESVSFPRSSIAGTPPADPYGRGWAVGASGTILGSSDFGQSWRIVTPFITTDALLGVARRSTAAAIAVGWNNRVATTAASADTATWSLAAGPTPFSTLYAVSWPEATPLPGSAWAVGRRPDLAQPVVLFSLDAGQSWLAQVLPATAPLAGKRLDDVFFLDDRRGWAVGTQGLILHTATGGR